MEDIIQLSDFRERRKKQPTDLTSFLKQATLLSQIEEPPQEVIMISSSNNLANLFQKKISQAIITQKLLEGKVFLCGNYVVQLLTKVVPTLPKKYYAIDGIIEYDNSRDPLVAQRAGDICFIICTVFSGIGSKDLNKTDYYEKMGTTLYKNFYDQTNREIGYYMSENFHAMLNITKQALQEIRTGSH